MCVCIYVVYVYTYICIFILTLLCQGSLERMLSKSVLFLGFT